MAVEPKAELAGAFRKDWQRPAYATRKKTEATSQV